MWLLNKIKFLASEQNSQYEIYLKTSDFNNNEKTISLLDNVFTLKDMTVDIIDTIFYYENDYS